jgi:aminoglycoside phosphotransferase (APT) family kinase protein
MDLTSLTPIEGGRSGETFLGEVGGERCVVRIYARPRDRGAAAAEVDAALLRLVRGLVPVPDVLEVRRPDPAAGVPGLLVTSFVPGVRGDVLLPQLDDDDLASAGRVLGALAATLAGMPALRAGRFVDGDLTVEPVAEEPTLHEEEQVEVESLALLDTVRRRTLVHGDLQPANVLLDPDTLSVTALVDWERAHCGHPFTDLGRLLRDDRAPVFRDAVLEAWCDRHGGAPGEVLALARAADRHAQGS